MVPIIKKRLAAIFGKESHEIHLHEPMKAVTYGAALHAQQLAGDPTAPNLPPELRGVTGHNTGVKALDPRTGKVIIDVLIKKNMPLPSQAKKIYYTSIAEQNKMVLEIVQYSNDKEESVSLGSLEIGPFTTKEANRPIEVNMQNLEDGTISLTAFDKNSGIELEKSISKEKEAASYLPLQAKLVRGTSINKMA